MSTRQIASEAFLYVLAFALLAMGLISLLGYLSLEQPSVLHVVLLPDSALLSMLLGALLLAAIHRRLRLFTGLLLMLLALSLYTLIHNLLAGGSDVGRSLISGFMRARSPLALAVLVISLSICFSLGGSLARWMARGGGVAVMLLAVASQLYGHRPSLDMLDLGFKFTSTHIANLFTFLLGLATVLLSLTPKSPVVKTERLPLLAAILGVLLTCSAWYLLSLQASEAVSRQGNLLLSKVQGSAERTLRSQLSLLERMAERWEALGQLPSPALWHQEAHSYLRDFPHLHLVGVLDQQFQPFWLESRSIVDSQWLQAFLERPEQRQWLEHVRGDGEPHLSRTTDTQNDLGRQALLASPLNIPGQSPRLIVASVNVRDAMRELLGSDFGGLAVRVFQGETQIYQSDALAMQRFRTPVSERSIELHHDQSWRLVAYADDSTVLASSRFLPALIMLFGLILSFFLMLSQRLGGVAIEHSRHLQRINRDLKDSLAIQLKAQALNQRIMQFTMDVLCSFDREGRFREVSPSCEKLFGYTQAELMGRPYLDLVVEEDQAQTALVAAKVIAGCAEYGFRNRYRHKDGRILHILWSADWSESEQTLFAVAHDITPLVQNEAFSETQREILSMISTDRPQNETLEAICHMVEDLEPEALCSVLLLDRDGQSLRTGAAPSLPDAYNQAVDGIGIGSNAGSCGTAAYRRQLVVVEDIDADPLWDNYRHLARPNGLRSCWSFPLISHHGQILGTFAMYHRQPQAPSDEQIKRLATSAQLAAIAIGRALDREQLQESEQRFRSMFTFNPDPVFSFDLQGAFQSMNGAGVALTGLREEQILGRQFAELILDADLERARQHFSSACRGIPQRYEVSITNTAGQQLHLDICNLPIMVEGQIVGVFGIAKDVTLREQMTTELQQALARSERKTEQLRRLSSSAIATARLHEHQSLIDYLVGQVRLTIGAHQAVMSLTQGPDWSRAINGVSLSDKYAMWRDFAVAPSGEGIYALICETNEPLVMTQAEMVRHPRWRGFGIHAEKHPPMRGWLAVPLIGKDGNNLGLLQLSDKEDDEFDADDLAIVQQFAQMAVSVLDNNRLLTEVMAAEQRLNDQLSFTSTITDCMAEGLLAVDDQGRLSFLNPAAQRWLAAGEESLLNQPLADYLPLHVETWQCLEHTAARGELCLGERVLQYEARPLVGDSGPDGWVLALHDVSAQRRADQVMRERDQFFSLSLEMFCMVGLDGLFIQVNPAFARTLRRTLGALVGHPYLELVHGADRWQIEDAVRRLQQGELIHNLVIRAWDGEGGLHWLQISAALGADRVIYCVARDITEQRAVQQQILQNNLILSLAGQTARLGGWDVELPSREVAWSQEMYALLGYAQDKVPNLDQGLAMYPDEHRQRVMQALEACITRGESFDLDVQLHNSTGALLDVRLAGQAVRDDSGVIVRISGALQDISERKRAEREVQRLAERLSTTLESITDAFYTLDSQWRFSYVNREAASLLGMKIDALLGQDVFTALPELRSSEIGRRYFRAVENGQAAHFDTYYAPLAHWFEIHAYPSEEGLAVYFRDISARKRTEQELQATLQELERSNRELQEFAFVASHDLQEPLRKIQTFSDRLVARTDRLDEEGRDYLQRMASAASRMQALIIDLLNYSRVNTRGQPLQSLALDRLLDEVLTDMEASIEQSGAQIERGALPMVYGDASQLRQVVQNLLSNALKFQSPGQVPHIRIYCELATGGGCSLCFADNGIGFDEKYLEKIFNPFQRLHGREAYAGTGIGLAIVKKIVERHGASINASSVPGKGSVFRITFPSTDKDHP
ncbi:PAS domain S-box protein [Pseudomonas sp. MOB-449]|nr:PAS domain S-box protein [Pseudomonas sp. MOB-449]